MLQKILGSFILIISLQSCSTYSSEELKNFDSEINKYIKDNKLELIKSNSGLYYNILEKGKGDFIQLTDSVSFKYEGKLLSGEIFDKQTKPITFNVKDLIAGWKEIMLKLKPGAKVFLIVPPHLGYGTHDLDDIPASSSLVFNMEIIDVQ